MLFRRAGYRLPAMLLSAGEEERRNASYDWHGLKRGDSEFALFQYTLAGRGALRYE